eukprot:TRINITY_DN9903_c0_g1_i1.p2 TRINITY_DN9903_c0_g1~~TRINITY_DN9903_c0_g1_i1.p2  ORF type:complete len:187 (+),score=55.12 TRINITY_DN9903_c0_g1_i1:23-562(+)
MGRNTARARGMKRPAAAAAAPAGDEGEADEWEERKRQRQEEKQYRQQEREEARAVQTEDRFWEEHLGGAADPEASAPTPTPKPKPRRDSWKAQPFGFCSIHKMEREIEYLRPVGPVRLKCIPGYECGRPAPPLPSEASEAYGMCCAHHQKRKVSHLRPKGKLFQCRPGLWCYGADDDDW